MVHLYADAVLPVPRTLRTMYRPLPRVCGRTAAAVVTAVRSRLSLRPSSSPSCCFSPPLSSLSILMGMLPMAVCSAGVGNGQGGRRGGRLLLMLLRENGCKLRRQNADGRRKLDAAVK